MPNTNRTLSPEARNLIDQTIQWLTPKGRWTKNWGFFKFQTPNGPDEYEIEDMDQLIGRSFENYEYEYEVEDPKDFYGFRYEVEYPLESPTRHPDASCLVGSLLINNNYRKDKVFEEAVIFLDALVGESRKDDDEEFCDKKAYNNNFCECRECRPNNDEGVEEAINNLVSLNDDQRYSHKRHVLNLFRRALKRS